MKYTKNYGLNKPEPADFFSVEHQNENMNKMETALAGKADQLSHLYSGHIKDLASKPSGFYLVYPAVRGMPTDNSYWLLTSVSDGSSCRIQVQAPQGDAWFGYAHVDGSWAGWTRLATAKELETKLSKKANNHVLLITEDSQMRPTYVEPISINPAAMTDMPYLDWWRGLIIGHGKEAWYSQLVIISPSNNSKALWFRNITNNDVGGWIQVATATPPQEFDLPMTAGFATQGKNAYFKTQDGVVTVSIGAKANSTGIVTTDMTFGTLPVGYRPNTNINFSANVLDGGNRLSAAIGITTSGEVKYHGPAQVKTPFHILANCSFLASP